MDRIVASDAPVSSLTTLAWVVLCSVLACCGGSGGSSASPEPVAGFAYVSNAFSKNISAFAIGASTGSLTALAGSPFAAGNIPSRVTVDPSGRFAYVANADDASISAYAVDRTSGILKVVARSPFPTIQLPSVPVIDPTGKFLYVAGGPISGNGSVAAFTIDQNTGALTAAVEPAIATGQNPTQVIVDSSGKFAYVPALGFLYAYTLDGVTGALSAVAGSPYTTVPTEPFILDSSGRFAYAVDGFGGSVLAYAIDSTTGALVAIPGSPYSIPPNSGSGGAEMAFDPSEKFLYVALTTAGSVGGPPVAPTGAIYAFARDISGGLTAVGTISLKGQLGSLVILPNGRFAYVVLAGSNCCESIVRYDISPATGGLSNGTVVSTPPTQMLGLVIDPTGRHAFVSAASSIFSYEIDPGTGALLPAPGSPYGTGSDPGAVTILAR